MKQKLVIIVIILGWLVPVSAQATRLQPVTEIVLGTKVWDAKWSQTGAYFRVTTEQPDQRVSNIYDRTGALIHENIEINTWEWHQQDTIAVVSGEDGIEIWSPDMRFLANKLEGTSPQIDRGGHQFSPDETRLATYTGAEDNFRLWDAHTFEVVAVPELGSGVTDLEWNAAGDTFVLITEYGKVVVMETENGHIVNSFDLDISRAYNKLSWNPDGRHIAIFAGRLYAFVWDVTSTEPPTMIALNVTSSDYLATWHPDGRYMVVGVDYSRLMIWDMESGSIVSTMKNIDYTPPFEGLAWHPEEPYLLTISGSYRLGAYQLQAWNWPTGEPISEPMFGGVLAGGSRWDDSGEYFILTSDIGRWQIFDKTLQLVVADYNIRGGFAAQERFHPQEAIFARNEDDSVALYHEWEEAPFERYAFVGDAMVPAVWSPDGESLLLVTEESLAYQKTTLHILHFE